MRSSVMRLPETLRLRWSALMRSTLAARDETLLFSDDQVRFLAERNVIYLTERPDGQYSTIIAHDFATAMYVARRRSRDEVVVDLMGPGFLQHLRELADGSREIEVGAAAHGYEGNA